MFEAILDYIASKFQDSQDYIDKCCLKRRTEPTQDAGQKTKVQKTRKSTRRQTTVQNSQKTWLG